MQKWLAENGVKTDSLNKKAVAGLLKETSGDVRTALKLRQQLAKSSVKKYQAMENAVCADSRARGMFKFYEANRTGRFAGKLVQLQNLPQDCLPDLAEARGLVKCGDYDALSMLYDDVSDTLSQLIRTAFVPQDGRKFIVADFSAIEARMIAWLEGGRRVVDHVPLNTPKSTTILSSIRLDGTMAFTTFQGGTTAEKFLKYLREVLIPTLRPGGIVVMDNLRTHHIQAVGELLRNAKVQALYLPVYSSDLNPIKKLWSKNLFSIYLAFLESAIIVEEEGAETDEKKLSERHQPGTI